MTDLDREIELNSEAIRAQPRNVTCRIGLVNCLKQLDRHAEALAVLTEGLALSPGAASLLVEQVMVLRWLGQLDAAQAAIAALVEHHPDHLQLPRLRAEL